MGEEHSSKRIDDGFLRKVIYILLAVVIGGGTGVAALYGQLQHQVSTNTSAIEKFDEYYQTMNEIKIMVATLLEKSEGKDKILQVISETQSKIYGEQQRRGPRINRLEKDIDKMTRGIK